MYFVRIFTKYFPVSHVNTRLEVFKFALKKQSVSLVSSGGLSGKLLACLVLYIAPGVCSLVESCVCVFLLSNH